MFTSKIIYVPFCFKQTVCLENKRKLYSQYIIITDLIEKAGNHSLLLSILQAMLNLNKTVSLAGVS